MRGAARVSPSAGRPGSRRATTTSGTSPRTTSTRPSTRPSASRTSRPRARSSYRAGAHTVYASLGGGVESPAFNEIDPPPPYDATTALQPVPRAHALGDLRAGRQGHGAGGRARPGAVRRRALLDRRHERHRALQRRRVLPHRGQVAPPGRGAGSRLAARGPGAVAGRHGARSRRTGYLDVHQRPRRLRGRQASRGCRMRRSPRTLRYESSAGVYGRVGESSTPAATSPTMPTRSARVPTRCSTAPSATRTPPAATRCARSSPATTSPTRSTTRRCSSTASASSTSSRACRGTGSPASPCAASSRARAPAADQARRRDVTRAGRRSSGPLRHPLVSPTDKAAEAGPLRPTGPRLRSTSAGPAIRSLPVVVEASRPRRTPSQSAGHALCSRTAVRQRVVGQRRQRPSRGAADGPACRGRGASTRPMVGRRPSAPPRGCAPITASASRGAAAGAATGIRAECAAQSGPGRTP